MSSSQLQLETLFRFNDTGRIISTREPGTNNPCPAFALIRSHTDCVWGVRHDLPQQLANELDALAQTEPVPVDLRNEPIHASRYLSLIGGRVSSGPAFTFPENIEVPEGSVAITIVERAEMLERNFSGWSDEEIKQRSPVVAIMEGDYAVSLCFCARISLVAAEAGLDTAEEFRRRGLGSQVTAAWARAIRATGRTPLYSTSWDNHASLGVARKLGLATYASDWSLSGQNL